MKKQKLPQPNDDVHLTDFGYKLNKSKMARQKALKHGSSKHGTLTVLRRLNLIRNLTKQGKNKKKLTDDVNYMKKIHRNKKKQI